jgi:hypothetical protein
MSAFAVQLDIDRKSVEKHGLIFMVRASLAAAT